MATKHGLGRGLGALIRNGTTSGAATQREAGSLKVPVESLRKSSWQPRRHFDEQALDELADSIRQRGVLQPLLVRSTGEEFELIAGERRLLAAGRAGLTEVPVIVVDAADSDALELALIENLQREDLNILEEAAGYRTLADRFNLTQDEVAARVGKARASVANALRILNLPDTVKSMVADGRLSAGHAKLLGGLDRAEEQEALARRAVQENLSVHNLAALIRKLGRAPRKPRASRNDIPREHLTDLSNRLHRHFGTGVRLSSCRTLANGKKAKGTLELDYYSAEDLNRLLDVLGVSTE